MSEESLTAVPGSSESNRSGRAAPRALKTEQLGYPLTINPRSIQYEMMETKSMAFAKPFI